MKTKKLFILIIATVMIVWFLGSALAFDKLVAFGDSLTDDGNVFHATNSLFPDPAYYWEGRFSNGPVWVEYLTHPDRLNIELQNRAIGGAQSAEHGPPSLNDQVNFHVATSAPPTSETLVAIWNGGNDFLSGGRDPIAVVNNIESAMVTLRNSGVINFLLLNLPDLGSIPRYLGTPESQAATTFSVDFNNQLAQMLSRFGSANPGVRIYLVDIYTLYLDLVRDPLHFGFNNATQESPNFAIPNNFSNSEGYVFWDDTHPTTETHALIADRAYQTLGIPDNNAPNEAVAANDDNDDDGCFIASVKWNAMAD